ncbi:MAG TPA: integrase core domain-containing protein [Armatimonadota bacterium]|nr:integrase core domain-containing protein [Armatimonadota bacterium]
MLTIEAGSVWVFSAVEHWNGECVGMYVCKRGTRVNAVQPVLEGVQAIDGSVARGVAQGLAVRLDHGAANCSGHFQGELTRLGITPSFSFVEEPQTNGVVERFNRTLKEQAIYGRAFRTLDEVREAVLSFRQTYNRSWRLEKLGFMTPREARQRYENERLRQAAA